MARISALPEEYGLVLTRVEEAGLAGGRPLDSLEVPEPERDPAAIATHAEKWARAHVRRGRHSARGSVFPPFDSLPDRRTAAWWVRSMCEVLPALKQSSREVLGWADYAQLADPRAETTLVYPTPTKAEIRAAARAAAADPDAAGPPPGWFGIHLLPGTEVATWLALRGLDAVIDVDARARGQRWSRDLTPSDVSQLRALVSPQLSAADRERLRAVADDASASPGFRLECGALVNTPAEHDLLVARLGIDGLLYRPGNGQVLLDRKAWESLVGAGDVDERAALAEQATQVADGGWGYQLPRAVWLAAFGEPLLDHLVAQIRAETHQKTADLHASALLGRLNGVAGVGVAVRIAVVSKGAKVARDWLGAHPEHVAAFDGDLPRPEAALLAQVRTELAAGAAGSTAGSAGSAGSAPAFGAGGLPAWWTEAVAAEEALEVDDVVAMPKRLPAYVRDVAVSVGGEVLDTDAVAAVLRSGARGHAFSSSSFTFYGVERPPLVTAVRDRMSADERDDAALGLLRGWLNDGAKNPQKGVFLAAGHLGGARFVAELEDHARRWPGQSLRARAEFAEWVLAATGIEQAVPALVALTGTPNAKGYIAESLAHLGALLGMTRDDLVNATVPELGFDNRGRRRFDYGARAFSAAVVADGKVIVRLLDADGRPTGPSRAGLPTPNGKDDAELASTARATFTAVRKRLGEVTKSLHHALERGMLNGRVWQGRDHETYLARHPVTGALVQALVWQAVAPDGSVTTVRIDEEREYLTVDEETYALPDGAVVRLPHPLALSVTEAEAWRRHLADHELVQPFEQIDRSVFALPEGQSGTELTGLPLGEVHPGTLVSVMERHGWRRDHADGTVRIEFGAARVLVVATVTGLIAGAVHLSPPQRVLSVVAVPFADGERHRIESVRLDWAEVDPLIVSEVRRALADLVDRAG